MSRNRVIRLLGKLMPIVVVFIIMLPAVCLSAEKDPLEGLIKDTLTFFSPLSMRVDERRGEELVLSGRDLDRIKPGMRVRIYRPGKPFRHPVTREVVGRMDVEVGLAQVVDTEGDRAVAKIISGEPIKGDEVRIGTTVIPVLFYQSPGLDYYLGDDYFRKLKKTGRFRVYEAPIEDLTLDQLQAMASEKGASVILAVDEVKSDKESVQLVQRLYWGDGSLMKVSNINVPKDYISELKAGTEFLAGIGEEPLLTYQLPYGAERLTSGDLNGDGKWEILLVSGNKIRIYSYDVDLSELSEYKIDDANMIVWVDTIDLDGDGKDEVCLTYLKGEVNSERESDAIVTDVKMPDAFISHILRYESGGFKRIAETGGFFRVVGRHLYHQRYSRKEIFSGPIREVRFNGSLQFGEEIKNFSGPIYDFAPLADKKVIAVDKDNRLVLLEEGVASWLDDEDLGGFTREFSGASPSLMLEAPKWHINDRLEPYLGGVFVPDREPLASKAKTIGYKSSRLLYVWERDGLVQKKTVINRIKGELLDYALMDNKIVVLSKPMLGLQAGNILKGENPFVKLLQVYSVSVR